MKIGVIGLGRVGLPVAVALQHIGGHDVLGYDKNMALAYERLKYPTILREAGFASFVRKGRPRFATTVSRLVEHADVIFVIVQTPHELQYGGDVPMPSMARDFDYTFLDQAMQDIIAAAGAFNRMPIVVIVSTVTPGTIRERYAEIAKSRVKLVYSPVMVNLGNVIDSWTAPDFYLIGTDDDQEAVLTVTQVYETLSFAPVYHCSIEEAELIKLSLNAYLSMKIVFANMLAELADGIGVDVDAVTNGLNLSNLITSPAFFSAGMGDGGPCRPRDLIALSWLAKKHDVSTNFFRFLVNAREKQTRELARRIGREARKLGRKDIVMLGWSYKPESTILDGSPARLLTHYLEAKGFVVRIYDPVAIPARKLDYNQDEPLIFVMATLHEELLSFTFPPGSVIIDPWRRIADRKDIRVVHVGGKK